MNVFRRFSSVVVLVALVGSGGLAACEGSDEPESSTTAAGGNASAELTPVKIGVLPISAMAPLYLGKEQGIFERHGIALEPTVAQSGAAIIPGVISGELQFGFANVVSLMIARDKGLPLKVVAQGSQAGPGKSSKFEGVLVKGSGPIKEPADLVGKTIAVNALNDIGGLLISGALAKQGIDPGSVEYTEIGFPDVNTAVDAGRVDAAYQTEPFLSQARAAGDRVVLYQYPALGDEITIATYFTTEKMVQEDPDLVRRFTDAMNESLDYARAHEDEVRDIVTTFTEIPPEAAQKMVLPGWNTNLDPATNGLDLVAGLAAEEGLIEADLELDDLLVR